MTSNDSWFRRLMLLFTNAENEKPKRQYNHPVQVQIKTVYRDKPNTLELFLRGEGEPPAPDDPLWILVRPVHRGVQLFNHPQTRILPIAYIDQLEPFQIIYNAYTFYGNTGMSVARQLDGPVGFLHTDELEQLQILKPRHPAWMTAPDRLTTYFRNSSRR